MASDDLTIQILRGIRDQVRETNERLDRTNERLDQTNERLDQVGRRQLESETRLTTELLAVVSAIHEVRDVLRESAGRDHRLGDRIEDHEARLRRLEQP